MHRGLVSKMYPMKKRDRVQQIRTAPLSCALLIVSILIVSSIGCFQFGRETPDIQARSILPGSSPHVASPDNPNAPNITLINPGLSANNSYISTSSGIFVFQIGVAPNETTATESASMENCHPQIQIDGGISENFTNQGGENWDWFTYSWPVGAHGMNHWIEINATNNNSYTATIFLNLTVDLNEPTFRSFSPAPGANVSTDCTVSVNATDDLSGISYLQLDLRRLYPSSWSSGPQYPLYNDSTHLWEWAWPGVSGGWVPGYYNLSFSVADIAGNTQMYNVSVILDYQAPDMLFISHANETAISGDVTFEIFARDVGCGVDNVTIQIGTNGETSMTPAPGFLYRYTLDTHALPDGALSLVVRSRDYSGILNQTHWELSVDNALPTIIISGKTTLAGLANLTLNCADGQGIGRILWRLDTNVYNVLPAISSQYLVFATQNYANGPHTLEIRVEDQAAPANVRVFTQQVIIDNTIPQVCAQNLWDGAIVDLDFVLEVCIFEVSGLADSLTFLYQLNDETWVVVPRETGTTSWRVSFTGFALKGGQNTIILRGMDAGGNYDDDIYYFIYITPAGFNFWLVIIIAGIAAVGIGLYFIARKFRHASKDYQQRLHEEVDRAREQQQIEKGVEEELSKVQIKPMGFLKKPEKQAQKPASDNPKQEE